MENKKISLWVAILININIIVGGAFFLGAHGILQKGGMLAPLTWVMWGLIILPIVLVLAQLSKLFPDAGGLYVYSQKALNPFLGFVSGWGYFIGSIAGNAILIHQFGVMVQKLGITSITNGLFSSNLSFSIFLIILFSLLNLLNVDFLAKAQTFFVILKIIPLFLVVFASFLIFKLSNVTTAPIQAAGFFESIPFVVFAYIGFEVSCAITHKIRDGQKNASKAILLSFGIIMAIYTVIQLCLLGIHGTTSTNAFLDIFPKLTSNPTLILWGNNVIEAAIASSFLAGFYAMFFANNWILYAIAQQKNLPLSNNLIKLNKFQQPHFCIILQSLLTILFLLITQNTYYLVTMSVFGVIISYMLSMFSFVAIYKNKNFKKLLLGALACLSSFYLLFVCSAELVESGIQYLLPFVAILSVGIVLNYFVKKHKTI